jgi:hypothetical protein
MGLRHHKFNTALPKLGDIVAQLLGCSNDHRNGTGIDNDLPHLICFLGDKPIDALMKKPASGAGASVSPVFDKQQDQLRHRIALMTIPTISLTHCRGFKAATGE